MVPNQATHHIFSKKQDPEIINYREHKNISIENYRQIIFDETQGMQWSHESRSFDDCLNVCKRALDICGPRKKRYLNANNNPIINKTVFKATRSAEAFAFCAVIFNDKHTKPRFKRKLTEVKFKDGIWYQIVIKALV